jgi:hypothetical protein
LPVWLAQRFFAVMFVTLATLWLPSVLVAIWAGVPASELGRFVAAFLLSMTGATALQVFMVTGKPGTSAFGAARLAPSLVVCVSAALTAVLIVQRVETWFLTAGLCACFGTSIVLYLWGRHRWKTIDLGA